MFKHTTQESGPRIRPTNRLISCDLCPPFAEDCSVQTDKKSIQIYSKNLAAFFVFPGEDRGQNSGR